MDPRVARSRASLLEAATDLLVDGGPRAVTVDAVSERSGVAKSTMYRHFPSRTDLLVNVVRHNLPKDDFTVPEAGFEESLRALLHGIATSIADPEWSRILPALLALRATIPELDDLVEADRQEKDARLRVVLERGIAEGLVEPDVDARTMSFLLIGPLVFALLQRDVARLPLLADAIVDRFLAGGRSG